MECKDLRIPNFLLHLAVFYFRDKISSKIISNAIFNCKLKYYSQVIYQRVKHHWEEERGGKFFFSILLSLSFPPLPPNSEPSCFKLGQIELK